MPQDWQRPASFVAGRCSPLTETAFSLRLPRIPAQFTVPKSNCGYQAIPAVLASLPQPPVPAAGTVAMPLHGSLVPP